MGDSKSEAFIFLVTTGLGFLGASFLCLIGVVSSLELLLIDDGDLDAVFFLGLTGCGAIFLGESFLTLGTGAGDGFLGAGIGFFGESSLLFLALSTRAFFTTGGGGTSILVGSLM